MTARLRHRGPDDEGFCQLGRVSFGHRRLAIIDLSPNGRQPMSDETRKVWLTYNGEVYNFASLRSELVSCGHSFRSNTDTEVVLRGYLEWGLAGLLDRLQGMFAFALYDHHEQTGYLVRDRFGIKPLYYSHDPEALSFSSEIPSLLEGLEGHGRSSKLSRIGLERFLALGSVPAPDTIYEGVQALPAGHIINIKGSEVRLTRYINSWVSPPQDSASTSPAPISRPAIREHLASAVRSQMVSDVPLGVFLSGGIDSSALVALAALEAEKRGERLATLAVSFAEKDHSEAGYARLVAERYRTHHREVEVGKQEFYDELPRILKTMGQPTVDGVNSYFVSRAAREAGLTVVLSGLGGDEIFLGYPQVRRVRRLRRLLRGFDRLPLGLRGPLSGLVSRFARALSLRSVSKAEFLREGGAAGFYGLARGLFAPNQIRRLTGTPPQGSILPPALYRTDDAHPDPVTSLVRLDIEHYLQNQLLVDTDQMSMAHSVEVRVPFLDETLFDAMAAVPIEAKLDPTMNKPLLVRSLGDELPRDVWQRDKQGFTFPMTHWLHEEREAMCRVVSDAGLFDPLEVKRVWDRFGDGRLHWSRPWALFVASECYRSGLASDSSQPSFVSSQVPPAPAAQVELSTP